MKSFLVPIGGSATDEPLFATALAAAHPVGAHLRFVHVHLGAGEAAANVPHTEFAMGPALASALKGLDTEARNRSAAATQHFRDFCTHSGVAVSDLPNGHGGVTASWREEQGHALKRIMRRARHHDMIVAGRAKKANGLPADFLEQLLISSGRPVLIANATPPSTLSGTVMVCWKEAAEAARAVAAAMPFLAAARRVVVVSVAENGNDTAEALAGVAEQLAWNGIAAETRTIAQNGDAIAELLFSAARDCGADLVVLGAYGHSRMREALFGSCTQAVIRNADRPVLMMH